MLSIFLIALKVIFVLVCLLLIGAVLLQSGKGGDVSAAFGGAGAQSAFGPRGATKPLEKATIYLALTFMGLALLFSLPGFNGNLSVVKPGAITTATPAPTTSASPDASGLPAPSPAASAEVKTETKPEAPAAKADDKKPAEEKKPEAKAEVKSEAKADGKPAAAPEKK